MPAMIARERITLYVYALCEPTEGFVPRYVGISHNVTQRLSKHRSKDGLPQVYEWMRSIGYAPKVIILEVTEEPRIFFGRDKEAWWINYLEDQGHSLLNRTNAIAYTANYRAIRFGKTCAKYLKKSCYRLKVGKPAQMYFQVDADGFPVPGKHYLAPATR